MHLAIDTERSLDGAEARGVGSTPRAGASPVSCIAPAQIVSLSEDRDDHDDLPYEEAPPDTSLQHDDSITDAGSLAGQLGSPRYDEESEDTPQRVILRSRQSSIPSAVSPELSDGEKTIPEDNNQDLGTRPIQQVRLLSRQDVEEVEYWDTIQSDDDEEASLRRLTPRISE